MSRGHTGRFSDELVWVALNGALVPPERATVSVLDRGFLYGDGVFETIRTYRGVPFRLREHAERLAWSADRVGMDLPLTVPDIVGEVGALVREVQSLLPRSTELVARLMVTRGEGPLGLDPAGASDPLRVLIVQPFRGLPSQAYREGVDVVCFPTHRPSDAALGAKVQNYLESILALRHARQAGAHEALIVSGDGCVIEGTTSNVLYVRGDELVTPPDYETLLPGITRRIVLDLAQRVELRVRQQRTSPADLAAADEVFLTSTLRELLPVVRIDGHLIAEGRPGPMTRRLQEQFRESEGLPGPAPWEDA